MNTKVIFAIGFMSLMMLFSSSSLKGQFFSAKIIFQDGKEKNGLVKYPKKADEKFIQFKQSESAEKEKIESPSIKIIKFHTEEGDFEMENVKTFIGWKLDKVSEPIFLTVLERGYATLYTTYSPDTRNHTPNGSFNIPGNTYWLCYREGEKAATMVSMNFPNNLAPSKIMQKQAPMYFKDYPELAKKIENKEYKWEDIIIVVKEYNKWKGNSNL